ncbi:methylated-DNA--[protein]-cysteine S-methyltransferase [Sutcliffiella rhizosphaerae]|uniref:Methylated-DNA--protein-cysteine methyltransferase n=1 Tax=Sutcliffiella rhizosphaerae TaxID=2880967 RepID=A0ABM8YKQ8_9BACI|nr:methylated-DNA--[protein]-cysteine S-methyltransferase [Sutcliffiella rhizosphaerae]CAG9620542.1 Methylated-DNA--protein-cysteine methyltransferase, constitutive [Sutcliffiella rhizosphaerae]
MFYYDYFESPIGTLYIVCEENYLVKIEFGDDFLINAQQPFKYDSSHAVCSMVINQLKEYFNGNRKSFDVPLRFNGTDFQMQVWEALNGITYGKVKSYQDIAVEINRPLAVRAIGQANKRNPIPIIIPCHRVIGKNKSLVGYAGDKIDMKEKLLTLEGSLN